MKYLYLYNTYEHESSMIPVLLDRTAINRTFWKYDTPNLKHTLEPVFNLRIFQ